MAVVIKTVNLTKRYGTLVALSNLNLEIQEGDCFGFIGPNGAGKTTTIKILATLLQPTWGEARICDFVVGYQSRQIRLSVQRGRRLRPLPQLRRSPRDSAARLPPRLTKGAT